MSREAINHNSNDKESNFLKCDKCNSENNSNSKFCSNCGISLSKFIECSNCKKENAKNNKYCFNCGNELNFDKNETNNDIKLDAKILNNHDEEKAYYRINSTSDNLLKQANLGPMTVKELTNYYNKGTIDDDTLISIDNMKNWIWAGEFFKNEMLTPQYDNNVKIIQNENNNENDESWYVSKNGKKAGPFTIDDLQVYFDSGEINHGTQVYKNTFEDWKNVENTELSHFLKTPPPLKGDNAPNGTIWWVAFSPLISLIIVIAVMSFLWENQNQNSEYIKIYKILSEWNFVVYILVNLIFVGIDSSKLKNYGHDVSKFGTIFIIPVYIWKRNKILKKTQASFWIWMLLAIFEMIVSISVYGDYSGSNDKIERINRNSEYDFENPNESNSNQNSDNEKIFNSSDKYSEKVIDDDRINNEFISKQSAIQIAEKKFNKYLPKILESHSSFDSEAIVDTQTSYTGDFTGDGIDDIAIYFYLVAKEGGNACLGQGITLYKNTGKDVKVIAGYDPDYSFSFDRIDNGLIYVNKLEYADDDARCCPSIRIEHALTIIGTKAY